MPIKSRWQVQIPCISYSSLLFNSYNTPLPSIPFLIDAADQSRYLSLATFRLWSQRLAVGLKRAGLQSGDRVLVFSRNNIFFPVVIMGVIMAGGIFTAANPAYNERELLYQLRDSGAAFLLCGCDDKSVLTTASRAAAVARLHPRRVFAFDDGVLDDDEDKRRHREENGVGFDIDYWTDLIATVEEGMQFEWQVVNTRAEAQKTIILNYSSGTTGLPKGVEITHYNYVANACQLWQLGELAADAHKPRKRRLLCFLPLYHAMAQMVFVANAALRRHEVYMMQKFDFVDMLKNIERHCITDVVLVPPILVAMSKRVIVKNYNLNSIAAVFCGAAPITREACVELKARLSRGAIIKQGWGMTEVTCSLLGWHPDESMSNNAVGEVVANCEAMIVDDQGKELGPDERGEMWVRGPNVTKGYWQNEKATMDTLTKDGWLKTGDIAYYDSDKKFHVVDRKKELIKVKGNQVAPAELEGLLLEHPAVADAGVVGVGINGDECPRAYVVILPGHEVTSEEIIKFVDENVAKYKRITGGVVFVESIPKTPSGKIIRRVLRDLANKTKEDTTDRSSKL